MWQYAHPQPAAAKTITHTSSAQPAAGTAAQSRAAQPANAHPPDTGQESRDVWAGRWPHVNQLHPQQLKHRLAGRHLLPVDEVVGAPNLEWCVPAWSVNLLVEVAAVGARATAWWRASWQLKQDVWAFAHDSCVPLLAAAASTTAAVPSCTRTPSSHVHTPITAGECACSVTMAAISKYITQVLLHTLTQASNGTAVGRHDTLKILPCVPGQRKLRLRLFQLALSRWRQR